MVYAIDARTGRMVWERTAFEGEPLNKRHIKSTYASASPATDGRIVVAWFGSQGVYAYDYRGALRWKVDLGRVDMGAYDIPTFEWGPASSPIIWNGLVILQCDTQADSFIVALDADTGETVWKTDRDELPSWGTPTVVATPAGPQLVTNASNFIRGYDPRTGKELWKLGRSSKITAPTPISGDGLLVVASGRGPERPLFVVRPDARGDLTLRDGETRSAAVAWSRTGRGSYMPTPLFYNGLLYVLANNGVFDAYQLKTGEEVYRQRLPADRQRLQRVAGRRRRQDLSGERGRRDAGHRRRRHLQAHRDELDGRTVDGDARARERRDVRAIGVDAVCDRPQAIARRCGATLSGSRTRA